MDSVTPTCFVISPIGMDGSETRTRSDQYLKFIFRRAGAKANVKVVRADEIDTPGIITHQIVTYLVKSEIVLADLTDGNPNVFYELAIRHFTRRPVIHVASVGEKLPFDINNMRTIFVDIKNPESVEKSIDKIATLMSGIVKDNFPEMDTPISLAAKDWKGHGSLPPDPIAAQALALAQKLDRMLTLEQRPRNSPLSPPPNPSEASSARTSPADENRVDDTGEPATKRAQVAESYERLRTLGERIRASDLPEDSRRTMLDDVTAGMRQLLAQLRSPGQS